MKKKFVFSVIAFIAATAGIAWAIAKALKSGKIKLNKDLDEDYGYDFDEDYDSSDEALLAGKESDDSSFNDYIPEEQSEIDIDLEPYESDSETE